MKFVGNLIFDNSTNQQLRTYFYNCDFSGTVTFPTSSATGTNGTQIFFDSCSFSSAMTINNQNLYSIFFTRCQFVGQAITNNQVVGNTTRTVFNDCSFLPTLSTLGFCVLNGPNTTLTTTQANYGSLVLGGLSTQYLMGNGSLLTATYPTLTTGSFSLTIPAGTGGTPTTVTVNYRKLSNGVQTTVWLIFPITNITNGNPAISWISSVAVLPADIRPAVATYIPIAVRNGTTYTMGLLWIYTSGVLQISDLAFTNSFTTAGAVCGINAPQQVTYVI
jgi:hypothetical protein